MSQLRKQDIENQQEIDLSIIIVNWNTKDLLRQCLQSIDKTTLKITYETWVIDNRSTDGSVEMIKMRFPKIRLITNNTNVGFAKANNLRLRKSRGRYVCLINTDVKILSNCLDYLCDYMERHKKAGMVAPRILNPDKTLQISCYAFPTFWNSLCYAFGLDKVFPKSKWLGGPYRKYWPYDNIMQVDVVSACFCMVRRDAIEEVGPLDEHFFMYMEDFDWCRRFSECGWEVVYVPEVGAIHYGGGSSSNASEKYWVERNRSMVYYWRKHHGSIGKWFVMFIIFLRQVLRTAEAVMWYVFRPSKQVNGVSQIRQSVASLRWLLNIRASKEYDETMA